MFYATRTQQIAANVTERQLLSFYSKADRDLYVDHEVAVKITAAEAKELQPLNLRYTVSSKELNMVFFATCVL